MWVKINDTFLNFCILRGQFLSNAHNTKIINNSTFFAHFRFKLIYLIINYIQSYTIWILNLISIYITKSHYQLYKYLITIILCWLKYIKLILSNIYLVNLLKYDLFIAIIRPYNVVLLISLLWISKKTYKIIIVQH